MSLKSLLTVVAILLVAVLTVGLIICRPMGPENYASGVFNFEAVSEVRAAAWDAAVDNNPSVFTLADEDPGIASLVKLIDGRGFGRSPGSLFSEPEPDYGEDSRCWMAVFSCAVSGSRLMVSYDGGILRLTGDGTVTVTTRDKEEWAQRMYALILSLYPAPEDGN